MKTNSCVHYIVGLMLCFLVSCGNRQPKSMTVFVYAEEKVIPEYARTFTVEIVNGANDISRELVETVQALYPDIKMVPMADIKITLNMGSILTSYQTQIVSSTNFTNNYAHSEEIQTGRVILQKATLPFSIRLEDSETGHIFWDQRHVCEVSTENKDEIWPGLKDSIIEYARNRLAPKKIRQEIAFLRDQTADAQGKLSGLAMEDIINQGKWSEALARLTRAIDRIDSKNQKLNTREIYLLGIYYYNRAQILKLQKNYPAAERDRTRARELLPKVIHH